MRIWTDKITNNTYLIKMLKFFLFLFAVSGMLTEALAIERRYIASLEESLWEMTVTTPIYCEMTHVIPNFGKAVFSRAAGRKLQLRLITQQRFAKGVAVEFLSESPDWKPIGSKFSLANLKTSGGETIVEVPESAARFAYLELHDGFHQGFYFPESKNLYDSMVVMMSTVRFRSAEPDFEQCVRGLYLENFEEVKFARIHFDHDEEFPRIDEEDHAFTRMLDYLMVDPSIREVVISGHADHTGSLCYNDSLSARRAWYVYDLLLGQGVDPKLLRVDFFGERKPLRPGKSVSDLAANRRVSVELRR